MTKISMTMLGITAMLLSGCATQASVGQMAYTPTTQQKPANASMVKAISVDQVTGGHETNPLWLSEISNENFKAALIQSLQASNLYHIFPGSLYKLNANLIGLKQPKIGINFNVVCTVQYTLQSIRTGKYIYNKTITSSYTATFGRAMLAVDRLKIANEGAARTNIQQFIQSLYRVSK